MDKEQALARFVRENLAALSDLRASREAVKVLRRTFFERNHLSAGNRFSGSEVALSIAKDVIRARRSATSEEKIEILKAIPIVREELTDGAIQLLVAAGGLGEQSVLRPDDVRKLHQLDYIEEIEAAFRGRAEVELAEKLEAERKSLAELRTKLDDERQELALNKSILDSIPPSAKLDEMIGAQATPSQENVSAIWWRELGLEMDPFPSNMGLTGIPVTKYENVVVQTPFIQQFLMKLEQSPTQFLGKSLVVLGEFGSGKTTLFQMIGHRVAKAKIVPISVVVIPEASVARMVHQLISQVKTQLSRVYSSELHAFLLSRTAGPDEIGDMCEWMAEVARRSGCQGFLILLDGLHKGPSYHRQSLEFMGHLQSIQERLTAEGVSSGLLIAGAMHWERDLELNPVLSGSFYRIDRIPPLAEDQAVEAVIRRIHSFMPTGRTAPPIIREPLAQAFRVLNKRLMRPSTFRDFLDHVRDRFTTRSYAEVGLSLALHHETIQRVQTLAKASPLAEGYENLANPLLHSEAFRNALRAILPAIYEGRGMTERNELFRTNTGAFYLLRSEGFIVARRDSKSKELSWHLSEPVVGLLEGLRSQHRIEPSVALEALFTTPQSTAAAVAESIYGTLCIRLATQAASWRSSWSEVSTLLDSTAKTLTQLEAWLEPHSLADPAKILNLIRRSTTDLMRALELADGQELPAYEAAAKRFPNHWYAPENAESMLQFANRMQPLPEDLGSRYGVLFQHSQHLADLSQLLSELVQGEAVCRLSQKKLSAGDRGQLHAARIEFISHQYQDSVDELCGILEAKVRDTVYPIVRCMAGHEATRFLTSPKTKEKVAKPRGHVRARRQPEDNYFFLLSRSEYTELVFDGAIGNWLFKDSKASPERQRLRDSFALAFSLGDRAAHNDRPSFFREKANEIGEALRMAPVFLELMNEAALRLLIDPEFIVRRASDLTAEIRFGSAQSGFVTHRVSALDVEHHVHEILELLASGEIRLPPLSALTEAVHARPEETIGILRGCVGKDLITIQTDFEPLSIALSLTEKGTRRLAELRSRRLGIPDAEPVGLAPGPEASRDIA